MAQQKGEVPEYPLFLTDLQKIAAQIPAKIALQPFPSVHCSMFMSSRNGIFIFALHTRRLTFKRKAPVPAARLHDGNLNSTTFLRTDNASEYYRGRM
jgi:hypothetical protein